MLTPLDILEHAWWLHQLGMPPEMVHHATLRFIDELTEPDEVALLNVQMRSQMPDLRNWLITGS
jgi:hypothetical protein